MVQWPQTVWSEGCVFSEIPECAKQLFCQETVLSDYAIPDSCVSAKDGAGATVVDLFLLAN